MALWSGSADLDTNELAAVFNQLANKKAFSTTRKKNGLLFGMLGKEEALATPGAGASFKRLKKITGGKIEVRLRGAVADPTYISDANQTAARTLTQVTNLFGNATFDLAHLFHVHPIPYSEMDRFAGDEAKTLSYVDEVYDAISEAFEKIMGTGLWTNTVPSRSMFGGLRYALNQTANSGYGGIDRTDADNANYLAPGNSATGTMTVAKLHTGVDTAGLNGGQIDIAATGITVYGKLRELLEAYTLVTYDEDWTKFGGKWLGFAGVKFILDYYAATGVMPMFDSSSWGVWTKDHNLSKKAFSDDITVQGSYVIPCHLWCQAICLEPRKNYMFEAIT